MSATEEARLTAEQAMAVATDEDVTLVLAGAGTGKTTVITGKTAHLVRDRGAAPGEILVLAFNRKAKEEIRERLPGSRTWRESEKVAHTPSGASPPPDPRVRQFVRLRGARTGPHGGRRLAEDQGDAAVQPNQTGRANCCMTPG